MSVDSADKDKRRQKREDSPAGEALQRGGNAGLWQPRSAPAAAQREAGEQRLGESSPERDGAKRRRKRHLLNQRKAR